MEKNELEIRTKTFALRIIKFVADVSRNKVADVLGRQLLKSGTSIGANYREARRAESLDDFIHKIGIVEKEANESKYWLELFYEANFGDPQEAKSLLHETTELLAIFTRSGKTAKTNRDRTKKNNREAGISEPDHGI
jgi:four helix bundle protein